nr:hypothetical protein [Tanacetum cinerariifolium]
MVAYLQKPERSEEFHKIVYFLNTSHIRYALNENPTIYVSLIQQFWQTATTRTLNNGEMEITATIDGKVKGLIFQGEGSTILVESHHTPTCAPSTSQPYLSLPPRSSIKQGTDVHQPSSPTHTHVAYEAASTGVDVKHGGAATTVTSLDTELGSGNIDKTPSMPHDLPLPRVNTLKSDEGRMQHNELMDLVTKLSDIVLALETDLKQTKKVYGAAYTKLIMKGRKIEEIDQDPDISLIQHDADIQGRYKQDIEFDFDAAKEVSTAEQVSLLVQQLLLLVLTLVLLRRLSFDEIKELFETAMKRVNTFVPIDTERTSELAAKIPKRVAEEELDQGSYKRQKTNEASGSVQEQPVCGT